ncbi:hypothetical protein BH20ACT6_BH20ACT6_02750 [soil metagenome]
MTERKKLKARVRARMARTGETYTTAHRHVAVGDENPAGRSPFEHRESALSRLLLAHAGVHVSEPMACGLGGGIGFLYAVFEYEDADHPVLTIVAQHHPQPWLEAIAGHIGARLATQHSTSPRPALTKLDRVLTDGTPAQLTVERGRLPWHDATHPQAAADPYPVVVTGRQDDAYLVTDRDDSPRPLDRGQLGAAWAAHRKGRFALSTLAPPAGAVDLAAAVRRALTTTTDHLTGPVLGHAFDANFGLSGMARLSADLRDTRTKSGWVSRFGEPAPFAYVLARLAECLTTSYTGAAGTRPLYARFLVEAAGLFESPQLSQAAERIDAAAAQWRAVANAGLRTDADPQPAHARAAQPQFQHQPQSQPAELFTALADRVDAAAEHEHAAVELIRRALR